MKQSPNGYQLTRYINSGDTFADTLVKNWLNALPDCFSIDFVKDCSRHGNPNQYKIVITKN
tara:strand:+ start:480 stop:662 length:183 start_codon:yes stop_codon:yes gene_type:complete